jgi:hypothetical protein
MYSLNKILPCSTKPKEDELFSCWLIRLSNAHFYKCHSFYSLLFPKHSIWNRDIDKSVKKEFLEELSVKTLSTYEELYSTTLKSYEGNLYLNHNPNGNSKWILPLGIEHRKRYKYGLTYCPSCLKKDNNDPYYRKSWRLSLSIICESCGCYLRDCCSNCKNPIAFHRNYLGKQTNYDDIEVSTCFFCGFNLSNSRIIHAEEKYVKMQEKINRILRKQTEKRNAYPHLYFDVLHHLIQALIHNIEISNRPRKIKKNDKIFESFRINERKFYLTHAFWLLEGFPDRFIWFMKRKKIKSTTLFKDFKDIPYWYYQVVYENFYITNINRRF